MFIKNRIAAAGVIGALAAAFALVAPITTVHALGLNTGLSANDACDPTTSCLTDAAANPGEFPPGSTIYLAAGTFELDTTLVLDGVSLQGASQSGTIIEPSSGFTTSTVSTTPGPVDVLISVEDATPVKPVSFKNLTVQGPVPTGPTNPYPVGIMSTAGLFSLDHVSVTSIKYEDQTGPLGLWQMSGGYGVLILSGSATVTNCEITDFQKIGIMSYGTDLTVTGSTITGYGHTLATGQDGIYVYGGTATTTGNTISNLWYDNPALATASGIVAAGGAQVTSTGDTFNNVELTLGASGTSSGVGSGMVLLGETPDGYLCWPWDTSTVTCNGTPISNLSNGYWVVTFMRNATTVLATLLAEDGSGISAPSPGAAQAGYVFAGWYTMPNGAGSIFNPTSPITSNEVYYAHWTPVSVGVTYHSNPPTGSRASDSTTVAAGTFGAGYTVAANTFTMPGFTFSDWNTQPDGSGTSYAPGDQITLPASGSITLYAQWTPVSPTLNPSIGLQFDTATLSADGSTIDFVFLATNTGNVTLTNVNLSQVSFNGNLPGDPPCDKTTLAPEETTPCHAPPYTIQPNDIGATITAYALVEGTPPNGVGVVTGSSTVNATSRGSFTIPSKQKPHESKPSHKSAPSIDLVSNGGALSADSSQITYKFTITNDGNTSLSSVALIQAGFTGAGKPSISCAASKLAPDASTSCTVTYAVQPADVGTTVTFTGQAQGVAGNAKVKSDDVPASVIVPAASTPTSPKPSGNGTSVETGGSVAGSTTGLVGVTLLVAAGGVLLVGRRRLAIH